MRPSAADRSARESGGIAVVVVSWNTASLLRRCLCSLRDVVEECDAEVLVVDNASSDGSAELVEREFGDIARVVRTGANLGFGPAANLGARATSASWIVICNADVEVPRESIPELVRTAERDSQVALVAPRLKFPSGETQTSVFRFPSLRMTALAATGAHRLSRRINEVMFHPARHDPLGFSIDWAMGAFILMRRAAYDQVGGFADDQWMYAEDLDLAWRLRKAGWRAIHVPTAYVVHAGGAATVDAFGASSGTPEIVNAHYHWLRTRRGPCFMWLLASVALSGMAIRLLAYRLLGLFGLSGARLAYERGRRWFAITLAAARRNADA